MWREKLQLIDGEQLRDELQWAAKLVENRLADEVGRDRPLS